MNILLLNPHISTKYDFVNRKEKKNYGRLYCGVYGIFDNKILKK